MISGLHHVTAITAAAQRNVDFYAGVLGLRLVKRTVNFDDPFSHHLYYGTELGAPGTILTFFAWPDAMRGRAGNGAVNTTSLAVPAGSFGWWIERFRNYRVGCDEPIRRFEEEVLGLRDFDGMRLELVAPAPPDPRAPWAADRIPAEFAIRGLHGVTAGEEGHARTAQMLTGLLGFREIATAGNRFRYAASEAPGAFIDLLCTPDASPARGGAGALHHVAWRTADAASQLTWRQTIVNAGFNISPVLDRQYFHSIYFREPGGVLFEIATDSPGFITDESAHQLGASLKLPPWLESSRAQIEAGLPPIQLP